MDKALSDQHQIRGLSRTTQLLRLSVRVVCVLVSCTCLYGISVCICTCLYLWYICVCLYLSYSRAYSTVVGFRVLGFVGALGEFFQ